MKIKRILSLLASAAMAVTAITGAMSVSAETDSAECGEGVTWSFDSSTGVLTISGEGEMASPNVGHDDAPSEEYSDTYTYKKYKEDIKEVKFEEGVTSVGYRAFYKFKNLETVSLPSTITKFTQFTANIGYNNNAFEGCTSLKNLYLAEGMTAIGHRSFLGCTALETVDIPSTITEWGNYSFEDCTSLKNVTLHDGLIVLGGGAFYKTAIESIYIPSTIEKWESTNDYSGSGHGAFQDCTNLKSITFGDGLKELGSLDGGMKNVFHGCSSLEEVAFGDDSQLTAIAFGVFSNCANLKRVEIPDNVTNIQDVFTLTSSITSLYLYSRTLDAYNLPKNARILCYGDAVAKNQITCSGIENEISKTLNELKTAVKEAGKYSEKDYTAESYGALKALLDEAAKKGKTSHILGMEYLTADIYAAIDALVEKSDEPSTPSDPSDPSESDPSDPSTPSDSSDPTNPSTPTKPTGGNVKKTTSPAQKASEAKAAAEKAIKQAKIVSFTAKAKGKKKITVSWKKIAKAAGYEVQASTKKNFKKDAIKKTTAKNKIVFKKLKSKKKYFVRVRAYTTYKDAKGKTQKAYGKWVKFNKKVKVK